MNGQVGTLTNSIKGPPVKSDWKCALELDSHRTVTNGGYELLLDSIRRGADLRVSTEFYFEEHLVPGGDGNPEHNGLMQEVIDFRETILIDDSYAAGITTLRQPIMPLHGFNGSAPMMAFFLYGMDGSQGCANLLLGKTLSEGGLELNGLTPIFESMSKMEFDIACDVHTSGPSRRFLYNMEVYRFFVRDEWQEVFAHDEHGNTTVGSFDALEHAQRSGQEFKVAIQGLCSDLGDGHNQEVFSLIGSGVVHTTMKMYGALTHPIVRIAPSIPLEYRSSNWDLSWVYLQTDGSANLRLLNPYTREFSDRRSRFACRWFAR
jgi:hypothetical protein